jgi:hypothetical protein
MPTEAESKCCQEYEVYRNKIIEETAINCITLHPGFDAGCLNKWALQIAYYAYRQQHGHVPGNVNE